MSAASLDRSRELADDLFVDPRDRQFRRCFVALCRGASMATLTPLGIGNFTGSGNIHGQIERLAGDGDE